MKISSVSQILKEIQITTIISMGSSNRQNLRRISEPGVGKCTEKYVLSYSGVGIIIIQGRIIIYIKI